MNPWITSAVAGLVATGPMTLFMRAAERYLPPTQRYPLPPQQITAKAARRIGLSANTPMTPAWEFKTYLAHFAYGALAGSAFQQIASRRDGTSAALAKGSAFGLAVWTLSYLGYLPALRILPPATRHPPKRNALMIVAHLIWGSVLALLVSRSARRRAV